MYGSFSSVAELSCFEWRKTVLDLPLPHLTCKDVKSSSWIWFQSGPQSHIVLDWYQSLWQPVFVPRIVWRGRCGFSGWCGGRSSPAISWWHLVVVVFGLFLRVNDRQSNDDGQGSHSYEDPSNSNRFTDEETFSHAANLPALRLCKEWSLSSLYLWPFGVCPPIDGSRWHINRPDHLPEL